MKKRVSRFTGELLAVIILMALCAAGLWFLLRDDEKTVQWCYVLAGEELCRESLVPVTVVYRDVKGPTILSADFHGVKTDGTYDGYASSAENGQRVSGSGSTSFSIFTGNRKDISKIIIVIYLSSDGRWEHQTHSAVTKSIPLRDCGIGKGTEVPVQHGLFNNEPIRIKNVKMNENANEILKIINTVLILIIIVLACIKTVYPVSFKEEERRFNKTFWQFIAVCMILIGVLTIPPLRLMITDAIREVSRADGWYSGRRFVQRIAAVFLVAATAGLMGLIVNRMRTRHYSYLLIFTGTAVLFLITMLRLLSYHHADEFFNYPVMGLRLWLIMDCVAFFIMTAGVILQRVRNINSKNE